MGFIDIPETQKSSEQLLSLIAQSNAYSVIAGGDTIAYTQILGLIDDIDYVSTGGGAALQYVAGEILPGLEAIKE